MNLSQIISATYREGETPNSGQFNAIQTTTGPVLIVAGPGSGKTKTLITRTLNLLLNHKVEPERILLCTFTEKAARQLRERLNAGLNQCGAKGIDIHEMTVGTIHSVCQAIIDEYPNEAGLGIRGKGLGLGRGYLVLDELQRRFFLMEHFEEIYGAPVGQPPKYLGLWKGYWDTIERSQEYFDKITEENIDLAALRASTDATIKEIATAMTAYRRCMLEAGKVDFAHLQWLAIDLLLNNTAAHAEFCSKFEYVMVDEYQDTNYIQEQIIFRLASANRNICVVGDVDQSIYRFRGASTQNIMEFPARVGSPALKPINLDINYRSSQQIVDLYQAYLKEIPWGRSRYDLSVSADPGMEAKRPAYIANLNVAEADAQYEGRRVASLIKVLKDAGTITDYNQVVILLHSVRQTHSAQYIEAIRALRAGGKDIDVYAPRARLYFERPEVMCALAGLRALNKIPLSDSSTGYPGSEGESVKDYLQRCVHDFRAHKGDEGHDEFLTLAKQLTDEVQALKENGGRPRSRFIDYYYALINTAFMSRWVEKELPARHLAQLSNLIKTFMDYYGYEWVGGKNADKIWDKFFNSFLRILLDGGLNEFEDEDQAFPSGAVQIMTFHQSKGLEFPVVVVGSLHAQIRSAQKVDDTLSSFYNRPLLDPRNRVSEFDRKRLFYVAFSRAKDFLVLTGHNDLPARVANRKDEFLGALGKCTSWQVAEKSGEYKTVRCAAGDAETVKPVFGFTSHISAYERCPRQFQYQRQYGFVSVRDEQYWMGNVVHNTLKDIHDHVLKKKPGSLDAVRVKDYFDQNADSLRRQGIEPPKLSPARLAKGEKPLEVLALEAVNRYVKDQGPRLKHCRWAEKEILVEEADYVLTGVIDLLIHDDTGKVELVDFKAGQKKNNLKYREGYANQIRLYCQQVKPKLEKFPDEAYLYWVTEPPGVNPKDPVDTDPSLMAKTRGDVDAIARKIIRKEFPALKSRDEDMCGVCNFERRCWL